MKIATKEKPILFSGPMVAAILDGRKTMTRRLVKPQPELLYSHDKYWAEEIFGQWGWYYDDPMHPHFPAEVDGKSVRRTCPYPVGTRLWVREAHYRRGKWVKNGLTKTGKQKWKFMPLMKDIRYSDHPPEEVLPNSKRETLGWFKRPSLFMPRWASRLTLEVTGVKVERLQGISEADAVVEGVWRKPETNRYHYRENEGAGLVHAKDAFKTLWTAINGPGSWSANPWVWAYSFRREG